MQMLTVPHILESIGATIQEGLLGAQNAEDCKYTYPDMPGVGCAIGCALEEETIQEIEGGGWNTSNFLALVEYGIIGMENEEDEQKIVELQKLHDRWAQSRAACIKADHGVETYEKGIATAQVAFYKYLDELREQFFPEGYVR